MRHVRLEHSNSANGNALCGIFERPLSKIPGVVQSRVVRILPLERKKTETFTRRNGFRSGQLKVKTICIFAHVEVASARIHIRSHM